MPKTTCALYARVSTSDQNCELQLRELRGYARRAGWKVAGEYVDTGWSGAKASRPEFDKMMAAAAQRRFDAVMVWKLDRFGRSVVNCINGIQELRAAGVRFLAVSQNIDTDSSSPTSQLLLHILAAVAEFERELTRERITAGIRNARAKGVQLGRRRVVFDRERAREMRAEGMSIAAIAKKLEVGVGTIHRLVAA